MKKGIFSFVLLTIGFSLGLFVHASPFQTQGDMNNQASREYSKADKELNKVYNRVLEKYKDDKVFIAKFKKAELAWIKFKDAELEAIYPEPYKDNMVNYGSVYPMCVNDIAAEMTKERIKQLKLWLTGIEEGDVCAGSRRHE